MRTHASARKRKRVPSTYFSVSMFAGIPKGIDTRGIPPLLTNSLRMYPFPTQSARGRGRGGSGPPVSAAVAGARDGEQEPITLTFSLSLKVSVAKP